MNLAERVRAAAEVAARDQAVQRLNDQLDQAEYEQLFQLAHYAGQLFHHIARPAPDGKPLWPIQDQYLTSEYRGKGLLVVEVATTDEAADRMEAVVLLSPEGELLVARRPIAPGWQEQIQVVPFTSLADAPGCSAERIASALERGIEQALGRVAEAEAQAAERQQRIEARGQRMGA